MKKFSPILQDLIDAFKQLPGIGIKSAQRIVFYLLKNNDDKSQFIANTLTASLESIKECSKCRMYTDAEVCEICLDEKRNNKVLCIIESPADLLAIENTQQFNGKYFVLMGQLSPIDGIGPDELKINKLTELIINNSIEEVILASSPTVEGEATANYIASIAENNNIKASRIAYGVPVGGELEYVDSNTLIQAINNRNIID
ncbi:MAG: recombination mediator RecR [Gammaproteobacteria bacterium]|jgi:recombination protein RecR|nr:recombination protein RecR [Gammaproteobacteria bacterium]MBT5216821.1 recombination protein RecR [Gammaproteobacteria bacterium]MBT5542143.1 recombination protein RecR [Gammaproteobacteria bacterium]MBT7753124.1 recombination protein RecR [Gammaproteobacteria bacterium]MDG2434160.1 recombination mediator RecR [Gammaproteobacteria bacterium]